MQCAAPGGFERPRVRRRDLVDEEGPTRDVGVDCGLVGEAYQVGD